VILIGFENDRLFMNYGLLTVKRTSRRLLAAPMAGRMRAVTTSVTPSTDWTKTLGFIRQDVLVYLLRTGKNPSRVETVRQVMRVARLPFEKRRMGRCW